MSTLGTGKGLIYIPTKEIQEICFDAIESMEHWGRRLIHETLSEHYGNQYLDYVDGMGNRIVKGEIIKSIKKRVEDNPGRFSRNIDAVTLENVIEILSNDSLFKKHFKEVFDSYYPCGKDDLKYRLCVVRDVRNKIYHHNAISQRDAERAICYCHDFIDCLKLHYDKLGKSLDYNVPTFLSIKDSLGHNISFSNGKNETGHCRTFSDKLRSGDIYRIEVEIDSLFLPETYKLGWSVFWSMKKEHSYEKKNTTDTYIDIEITDSMVGRELKIFCKLVSEKNWHKHGEYDDFISITFDRILPPIEDSY